MSDEPFRKTIKVTDTPKAKPDPDGRLPILWGSGDSDERDVTKPVCFDKNGRPLYAPRGIRFWLPW